MSVPDTPAAAAQRAHEYVVHEFNLIGNIIEHTGAYDAKTDPEETTSLAAHIINAISVGINSFTYQAVRSGHDLDDLEEDLKVLAAALALHDTNKYVSEAYDVHTDGNTSEAFEAYFDHGDDFGIEAFLGEGYRNDLHYLVQRTEITEDSSETRGTDTEFASLERYCRTGDQVASVVLRDGIKKGRDELAKKFSDDDVHLLSFNSIEQSILNNELLGATKEVLTGEGGGTEYGVIIGSTSDQILYLGEPTTRDELREPVRERVSENLVDQYAFSCKLNWNAFEYDVLEEFALDPERKEEIIAEEFRDLLSDGTAGVEGFERISEEFDQYFAVLAKAIYNDRISEFEDDSVQDAYDRIYDEQGAMKVKIHFIAYLIRNFEEHRDFLDEFAEKIRPELHADLEPESDAVKSVTNRFFGDTASPPIPKKEDMCFLCGSPAETAYQKGLSAVYRTQEFSRRVPPHAKYKTICEVCNLEYALLADLCERHGVNLNANVGVAYYYFDDFLADIRLRGERVGIQQGEIPDVADAEITTDLIKPQYYIQPFKFGDIPAMGEKNHRMVVVRQLMQLAQATGMKVVLGRPFTRFESANAVFVDEDAIRPQELLGLDRIERFGPLPTFIDRETEPTHLKRALALCKIISTVGQNAGMSNPYLQLDRDSFHDLAHFAVVNHEYGTQLSDLETYLETYHRSALMNMQTVAERGVDLFGKQFDSKYKKTKIFREALAAFLSGKNQRMDDERLLEYVEGQVYSAAKREQYAGHVSTEEAAAFVAAIQSYLVENDLYTLKKLSDWEDALVNSYLYAYDRLLYADSTDDPESPPTNPPHTDQ